MRTGLLIAAVSLSLCGTTVFACGDREAISLASRLFAKHRLFYAQETPGLKKIVSPAFYQALKGHYRCGEKEGGICHLDYEPWLGAQDGEVGAPVKYAVTARSADGVSVSMSYAFVLEPGTPKKAQTVVLQLQKAAEPQCWLVDDLVTPIGDSLAKSYRGKP
ncbi:hypothetical protein [Chitinimonas sp.]|uniref:hypothetical protein n=1 Tax=Chitinimonas sp. TaxID=1934313 RepID=UPI0035B0EB64